MKQELTLLLKQLVLGRPDAAEAIAELLSPGCDICVMPGGKHFGPCPNNPEPKTFDVAMDPKKKAK